MVSEATQAHAPDASQTGFAAFQLLCLLVVSKLHPATAGFCTPANSHGDKRLDVSDGAPDRLIEDTAVTGTLFSERSPF
jgi:hypothetical protein